jgi:hypothetical protein
MLVRQRGKQRCLVSPVQTRQFDPMQKNPAPLMIRAALFCTVAGRVKGSEKKAAAVKRTRTPARCSCPGVPWWRADLLQFWGTICELDAMVAARARGSSHHGAHVDWRGVWHWIWRHLHAWMCCFSSWLRTIWLICVSIWLGCFLLRTSSKKSD